MDPRLDEQSGEFIFEDLNRPIPFTGGLLLGDGFLWDLYVHMGFHPGWKFETVVELEFAGGHLTGVTDHSEAAKEFRGKLSSEDLKPESRGIGWVEGTFDQRYDPESPFKRP
jgi:hypothetical protein